MTDEKIRPFKISVLIFLRDHHDRLLLLRRNKEPNRGLWSPIGGKLETGIGESPYECAIRETEEEIGIRLKDGDLHLFSMISEKNYEGRNHWLMFLFDCHRRLTELPSTIDEGSFAFFSRIEIDHIDLPETDRQALWPIYDRHRHDFIALRVDCSPNKPLEFIIEEEIKGP